MYLRGVDEDSFTELFRAGQIRAKYDDYEI
jgi:hypothetical protein